jgi:hypothetical protein
VVENVMTARRKELDEVVRRMGDDDRIAIIAALNKFAQTAGQVPARADTQPLATRAARQLLEER